VILSGFTPSDAAHVLGRHDGWHGEAARLAADLTARTERRPGIPLAENGTALAKAVLDRLTVQSCAAIAEAALGSGSEAGQSRAGLRAIMEQAFAGESGPDPLVDFAIGLRRPLIGIGAPARSYYPEIARRLRTEFEVPEHADVCNAVGAVAGDVSQRATVLITAPADGVYRVHTAAGPEDFGDLAAAAARAKDLAESEAENLALSAGAGEIRIETRRDDRIATVAGSHEVFIESRTTATAFGRPRIAAA
jgi:N-methylhydantoinase A/oxoprolinase/acetone carboxylase beta subunit